MKKFLYLGILLSTIHCSAFDKADLEEAISLSSLNKVIRLCGELDNEKMASDMRNKMYVYLHDFASRVTARRIASMSIFSFPDASYTLAAVVCICSALKGINDVLKPAAYPESRRTRILARCVLASGSAVLGFGIYHMYKGLSCSMQRDLIDDAKNIENFLEKKLSEASSVKKLHELKMEGI